MKSGVSNLPWQRRREHHLPRSKADLAELAWIWSIVGYSLLRFVVAWGAFSEHGANAWVFGIIDVGTAWPYAKSVATVCRRAADSQWSRLPLPLALAVVTFFAPYAYLWFAAGHMPAGLRAGMIVCVSVLLCAAALGALAKTRKLRRAASPAAETGETVIDLRDAAAHATHADEHDSDGATSDDLVIDLRAHDGPTELLIDLTSDEVSLERLRR